MSFSSVSPVTAPPPRVWPNNSLNPRPATAGAVRPGSAIAVPSSLPGLTAPASAVGVSSNVRRHVSHAVDLFASHMPHTFTFKFFNAVALAASLALTACGTAPSRIVSPGPNYAGATQVERLSVYVFIDVKPEYVHPEFRRTFEETLSAAFLKAGVPSRQVWSLDTTEGQRLQGDWKNSTMGPVTSVSVGKTILENRAADAAFRPSHHLLAFPSNAYKSGEGAILDIKWDIIDSRNGNVEWSVYTRTPALSRQMKSEDAAEAARGLVETITKEMQARSVLRR